MKMRRMVHEKPAALFGTSGMPAVILGGWVADYRLLSTRIAGFTVDPLCGVDAW